MSSNRIRDALDDLPEGTTVNALTGNLTDIVASVAGDIAQVREGLQTCSDPERGIHTGKLREQVIEPMGTAMSKLATVLAVAQGGGTVAIHLTVTPSAIGRDPPVSMNWYAQVQAIPKDSGDAAN